ncbi:MAG: hypothetical protein LBR15_00590 [Methanobrevibacter sp.]|jgi:hypothetical protein|nr:hypothetical protein [Candidatus Methanovirga australis]
MSSTEFALIVVILVIIIFMYCSIFGIQVSVSRMYQKMENETQPQPYIPTLPANLPVEQPTINPYENNIV